nr:hypothetical protein Iba_chr10fCG4560 [Ipomoea batatas]
MADQLVNSRVIDCCISFSQLPDSTLNSLFSWSVDLANATEFIAIGMGPAELDSYRPQSAILEQEEQSVLSKSQGKASSQEKELSKGLPMRSPENQKNLRCPNFLVPWQRQGGKTTPFKSTQEIGRDYAYSDISHIARIDQHYGTDEFKGGPSGRPIHGQCRGTEAPNCPSGSKSILLHQHHRSFDLRLLLDGTMFSG